MSQSVCVSLFVKWIFISGKTPGIMRTRSLPEFPIPKWSLRQARFGYARSSNYKNQAQCLKHSQPRRTPEQWQDTGSSPPARQTPGLKISRFAIQGRGCWGQRPLCIILINVWNYTLRMIIFIITFSEFRKAGMSLIISAVYPKASGKLTSWKY